MRHGEADGANPTKGKLAVGMQATRKPSNLRGVAVDGQSKSIRPSGLTLVLDRGKARQRHSPAQEDGGVRKRSQIACSNHVCDT